MVLASFNMNDNKILVNIANKNLSKEEVFHTSGAAKVQSGSDIGSGAHGISIEKRRAIEEQRKYTRNYQNSRIMSSTYALRKAQTYIPRTEGGRDALYGNKTNSKAQLGTIGNLPTKLGAASKPGTGQPLATLPNNPQLFSR